LEITNHSIIRYLERTENLLSVKEKITKIIKEGELVKPRNEASIIINNGFKICDYYRHGGLIAVVTKEGSVLTVMRSRKGQYKKV